jgi:sugar/nucleoside kinase (ribokinase family)
MLQWAPSPAQKSCPKALPDNVDDTTLKCSSHPEKNMYKKYDILGIGCIAIDDIWNVDEYPQVDQKVRVRAAHRDCGGLTATAMVAAARLGAKCAFGGLLGNADNELAHFGEKCLVANGVDCTHAVRAKDASPLHSFIVVASGGTRNIFSHHPGRVGADDNQPHEDVIRSSRILFCDHLGLQGNLRAIAIAKQHSIPVVADVERADDPLSDEFIAQVDHLIVSREFAMKYTQVATVEEAIARLSHSSRVLVAVTDGKEGCWWSTPAQNTAGTVHHLPAFQVEVKDTNGCGDVFHGAYAAALASDLPADQRIRFASAAAAIKATRTGGQSGAPTLAETHAFLNRY